MIKFVLMLCLLGSTISCSAQELSISDIFTIQSTKDIKLAQQFLTQYKGFIFAGSLGKSNDGCEVFKWTRGRQSVEIAFGVIEVKGVPTRAFSLKYIIPDELIANFETTLRQADFELYKKDINKLSEEFSLWSGSGKRLEDMAKMVYAIHKGSYYEIIGISGL